MKNLETKTNITLDLNGLKEADSTYIQSKKNAALDVIHQSDPKHDARVSIDDAASPFKAIRFTPFLGFAVDILAIIGPES